MDGEHFDDLSRARAFGAPRRDLLRGLAAGALAGLVTYLLGRPVPEAGAATRCDINAVYKCINEDSKRTSKIFRDCLASCAPKTNPWKRWGCEAGCSGRADRLAVETERDCRKRSPGCGGGFWCTEDIRDPLSGICCPPGEWAEGGVCKACNIVCDPAEGMVRDPNFCYCKCDVDKVEKDCKNKNVLLEADPARCRCRCKDRDCPKGQDASTCYCKCSDHKDCPYSCERCNVSSGICEEGLRPGAQNCGTYECCTPDHPYDAACCECDKAPGGGFCVPANHQCACCGYGFYLSVPADTDCPTDCVCYPPRKLQ
jgi:hypothetical protein